MNRNLSGFLPPFFLVELARRNPTDTSYLETLVQTQKLWLRGEQTFLPFGKGKSDRFSHDAENKEDLPGKLIRGESDPASKDELINRAHQFAQEIRDFYKTLFNRNGPDGNGENIVQTAHYGLKYNNAFFSVQMVYGDGDGDIFMTFMIRDVAGHEIGHWFVSTTCKLVYWKESGALNEHLADVLGVCLNQWVAKQTVDQADWLVGAGLFNPKLTGCRALRDMANPGTAYNHPRLGKDPQPAHMRDFVDTWSDNGGVHYNSGIPNRAFCVFAKSLGGHVWEKALQIWFGTALRATSNCSFQEWANLTVKVAQANYPETVDKLKEAWSTVGITVK